MKEASFRAALAQLTARPVAPCVGAATVPTVDTLVGLVGARRWRRSGIDAPTRKDIWNKTAAAIAEGSPLAFAVPFGGYKGPHQPSAPYINWAEVFWIAHLRAYAETLAAAYAPGVALSLSYFHGVLGALNGLSLHDQNRYIDGLRPLLAHFSDARIRFELVDLSQAFGGPAGAVAAIERRFQEMQAAPQALAHLPAASLRSAARNLVDGGGAPIGEDQVRDSALRCAAMESLDERRRFNKFSSRIQITHIRGATLSLHLGSCRTSTMQPWVGTGVLESRDGDVWQTRILNGRLTAPDALLTVRHPLEDIAPALRSIGVRFLRLTDNGGVDG